MEKRELRGYLFFALALLLQQDRAWAATYHCVSFEYPPLISQAPGSAAPSGFAVELVERMFRQLGASVTVQLYPWERAMAKVRMGEADCIFTIYRYPDRELFLDYSEQLVAAQIIYFYARKDAAIAFNGNLDRLQGLRVGVVRQINYGPRFERARPKLAIDTAADIAMNFRKLAAGRVDLVPSNLATAQATLALPAMREEAAAVAQLSPPVDIVPSFIAFSKRRHLATVRDQFDAALKKFKASPEYRHLLEKYGLESSLDLEKALQHDND